MREEMSTTCFESSATHFFKSAMRLSQGWPLVMDKAEASLTAHFVQALHHSCMTGLLGPTNQWTYSYSLQVEVISQ